MTADMPTLAKHFSVTNTVVLTPRYNIAPYQVVPVIRTFGNLEFLTWGFRPAWLPSDQQGFINARADTIVNKPSFKQAVRKRRCLIVADGFYEWRVLGKIKQPYYLSLPERKIFAFAGIWEGDSCAIITRDHRPIILAAEHYMKWLTQATNFANVQELIENNTKINFTSYPVSTIVNNTQHDVAGCVESLQ